MVDSLAIGGAQKLLVTFASASRERDDLRLTVISLGRDQSTPIPAELRTLGANVYSLPSRKLRDPRRFMRLVQCLRQADADVLQTHLIGSNILGVGAGRLSGVPVISTLHSAGRDPKRHHAGRFLAETMALRHGARDVVAVGHAVAQVHQPRMPRKPIIVVPNAVEAIPRLTPAERLSVRRELVGDPQRRVLISVGRLAAPKGYSDLLCAIAQLRATNPDATLVLVGSGSLQEQLEGEITRLGLSDAVILLGARDDVPRLLGASDLFVSSSHWEGLPLSVLEAMSAGLPVVATCVGDVARVVGSAGIVVAPHAPEELAAAVRAMLDDPIRLRTCGATARAVVESCYTPSVWLERLVALYANTGQTPAEPESPRMEAI